MEFLSGMRFFHRVPRIDYETTEVTGSTQIPTNTRPVFHIGKESLILFKNR